MNRRKRTFRRPRPASAPARNHPRTPANLDLFPYEASARPVAGLAVDYEDGHRVRRHRHRRAAALRDLGRDGGGDRGGHLGGAAHARRVGAGLGGAWHPHERRAAHAQCLSSRARPRLPTQCVLSISPLLRELMAAATEVPLDWQPGTRDGRLMMLLLDELRQEPVLPLHLPQPAERLARICRAIVRHPERQDGVADWALVGVDPKTVQRLFLRHTGMTFGRWRQQRGCWRRWNGWRAASGCWTWRWTWATRVRAPSRPCSARRLGEPPSAFAARGGRPPEVAGPARASGRKLARTWPEVSANLARGAPPGMSPGARARNRRII